MDVDCLSVDSGASSIALAARGRDNLAVTVAASTRGLHVKEASVDHFL